MGGVVPKTEIGGQDEGNPHGLMGTLYAIVRDKRLHE